MKLLSFDDADETYQDNRYISADIEIHSGKQLIYKHYKEELINPSKNNLQFLFNYLSEGDSAIFMVDSLVLAKQFPQLTIKSAYCQVKIKAHKYLTENNNALDKEMLEQLLLNKYLRDNNFKEENFRGGIYVKKIKKGAGKKIKSGDLIEINYKGSFINRIEFDGSYQSEPFSFTYGTPGQVIKGLEIAINGMREGEKSKIIIPSQLAFGEEGSSTQIIPSYTTVVYELEIINVK